MMAQDLEINSMSGFSHVYMYTCMVIFLKVPICSAHVFSFLRGNYYVVHYLGLVHNQFQSRFHICLHYHDYVIK